MSKGQRYAVLIGSSRFDKEPRLNRLNCPENDVAGFNDLLAAKEFGGFDNIVILKNKHSHDALIEINRVFRDAQPDDLILIYYSGHGNIDKQGELYLATIDTQLKLLESTSIPFDRIYTFVKNSDCKRI